VRLVLPEWRDKRAAKKALAPVTQRQNGLHVENANDADAELVRVYTDGACKGNPGRGGWGAILRVDGEERELFGGEPQTTNNRMELTAVIRALELLKPPCRIEVYTDSQYVQKGISEWLPEWKRRGWRTADKKPVKNVDLWQELDRLAGAHRIAWHWVKGHAGIRKTSARMRSRIAAWKNCRPESYFRLSRSADHPPPSAFIKSTDAESRDCRLRSAASSVVLAVRCASSTSRNGE